MASEEDREPKAIGRRLRVLRQVYDLSQIELCRRAGLAPNKYNAWELGKKRPSLEGAYALCDTFNLTLDWIFQGELSGLNYNIADRIQRLLRLRSEVEKNNPH